MIEEFLWFQGTFYLSFDVIQSINGDISQPSSPCALAIAGAI